MLERIIVMQECERELQQYNSLEKVLVVQKYWKHSDTEIFGRVIGIKVCWKW
jgi:hypothetical protein